MEYSYMEKMEYMENMEKEYGIHGNMEYTEKMHLMVLSGIYS